MSPFNLMLESETEVGMIKATAGAFLLASKRMKVTMNSTAARN